MKGFICGIVGMVLSMVIFSGGFLCGGIITHDTMELNRRANAQKD